MINSNPESETLLPSELEHRQIFFWLKKTSSATAWRRIFGFYKSWADVVERSIREADDEGWADKTSLPESDYVLILKGLAHCEEGVIRLEHGDKRVFKFDGNGEFEMASRILNHWMEILHRIDTGDNGVDEAHTPLWRQFCNTLNRVSAAWRECSIPILEQLYVEGPAPLTYNSWLREELEHTIFPDQIEEVPNLIDSIFINTNDLTPFSGIWEPIEVEQKKSSLLTLLVKQPKPQPPFKIAGTMNYLHGGSNAPQMTASINDESIDMDTTWRLIWRDGRYLDHSIPKEELSYSFTGPEKIPDAPPTNRPAGETIWAETGTEAPYSGQWLAESDLNVKIAVEKGAILPAYLGREVRWVLAIK